MYTRTVGLHFPPLDVDQTYHVALARPVKLSSDQSVQIYIISTPPMQSGITAGLNIATTITYPLSSPPFRAGREFGPISNIQWSDLEIVATGNQIKGDPLCAPQNNAGIVADADGTLFNFTAFYSVDEQYGGGRFNSYSRIFGFRKSPKAIEWENIGLIVEPLPYFTYAGDPFVFRDLDDIPCIVYTTVDGTQGFSDWTIIDARIIRSTTKSFNGPWGESHAFFVGLPGNNHDDRANCLRIYPRKDSGDYVMVWQHGERDIVIKGLILPSLTSKFTHEDILTAPILVRNQEEGGGGFVHGSKGYLSTWQIPSINDPTTGQRLYEFDLNNPLDSEAWRVLPGSWGWNRASEPYADGGITADSFSMTYLPATDELHTTMIAYSKTHNRNTIQRSRRKALVFAGEFQRSS